MAFFVNLVIQELKFWKIAHFLFCQFLWWEESRENIFHIFCAIVVDDTLWSISDIYFTISTIRNPDPYSNFAFIPSEDSYLQLSIFLLFQLEIETHHINELHFVQPDKIWLQKDSKLTLSDPESRKSMLSLLVYFFGLTTCFKMVPN